MRPSHALARNPLYSLRMEDAHESQQVLVAEDDKPLRKLIELTLRRERLSVVTAADGEEAIRELSRARFRVLVLDLMMPKVSGWDVIEWLRDHPERAPRTVIVSTAADRSILTALDPGVVNAILIKPFNTHELAGYVHRCCATMVDRDRRRKRLVGSP